MNSKTTLSISEARKKIFDIGEEVQKPNVHYTLTENGKPKMVIMGVEEFESWQETLEVMKDFPNLKEDMQKAEREYKRGEFITLEDLLAQEVHELHTSSPKKGSKRSKKN